MGAAASFLRRGAGARAAGVGRVLFIDVQHGLANRLRAIASAVVIARRTGLRPVVIWVPDHHCEAPVSALLDLDLPVIEDRAVADRLRAACVRDYNYMEIEPGSDFGAAVLDGPLPDAGDVYVRSAYTLVSPHTDAAAEAAVLRALRPRPAVRALLDSVPHPSDLAAHVRMGTGPAFDAMPWESPANWPAERHRELTEWREKSHVDRFIARIDRHLAEAPQATLFVAADLENTYDSLQDRYGARLRRLPRPDYDRSARQVQYALADLMLLAAAPLFLASHWSAFSDVAQRIARPGRRIERSGIDF